MITKLLHFKELFYPPCLFTIFITQILNAQNIKTPFNVSEVTERVNHNFVNFREDEFLIDTNVVYVPVADDQKSSSVAFDGTNYLVVWADKRSGSWDIYGARVAPNGMVLDPSGILISTAANHQRYPSVAFDGINYLVVWEDERNGSYCFDIYGARVTTSGTVLDPEGIPISVAPNWQESPSITFDGTNYLVVWEDNRSSPWDIYGARVAPNGMVLDTSGILISTAANHQRYPSVAFDGINYLVVWEDNRISNRHIYGARVAPSGTVLDPEGIPISTTAHSQASPSIAFDGINYLVVWSEYRSDSHYIYCARVTTSGTVLDPEGILISTTAHSLSYPFIAFDGTNYFVVWNDIRGGSSSNDLYGARVAPNGAVLDPEGIPISTAIYQQSSPSVIFGEANYLVVWEDSRSGSSYDIYGARVDQNGMVLDSEGILISIATYAQYSPSTAFDGMHYLVVWSDYRDGAFSDIYGARVASNGTVLEPSGIPISTAANSQKDPSVAFDGTNYLVVWEDYRSGVYYPYIYGARVTTSGTVLDPEGIPISTAAQQPHYPSIAFDGTNYLVVWEDFRSGSSYDIYGARVDQNGTVLDTTGIPISTGTYEQRWPTVAFDDTNYLVVWANYGGGSYNIYGARVSQDGVVLDPFGIAISNAPYDQYYPFISFDGMHYLVVWSDYRDGAFSDIYGARVAPSGTVLDPEGIPISTAANHQRRPSVAYDGINYLVVWEDYRSGVANDIYGARVNSTGTVTDSFLVSNQQGDQILPIVAHGPGSEVLICYSGYTAYINGHPTNTMRIWGKFYPLVGVEKDTASSKSNCLLLNIHPNPFYSLIKIQYTIIKCCEVSLKVYNINGQLVRTLVNAQQSPGTHEINWNGTDDSCRKLSQGVYFLQMDIEDYSETKKIVRLH